MPCIGMMTDPVPIRLKRAREAAKIRLRQLAKELGLAPSSYGHYEDPDRFKAPYLPYDFAARVADAFEKFGASRTVVMALAGPPVAATLDARVQEISARRQQVLLDLLAELEAAEAYDRARGQSDSGSQGEAQ